MSWTPELIEQSDEMKPIIAAVIGGVVGAIIWGAISYFTGYEVGYVAWGIGALVGILSAKVGGEGMANGVACAVVTILALVAGKMIALEMTYSKELKPIFEPLYEEQKGDAQRFSELASKEDWKAFIFENGYTESETVEEVSSLDLAFFEESTIPLLEQLNAGMTYKEYENLMMEEAGGKMGVLQDSFGMMDIVFFLLGIVTAFKIGMGNDEAEA